MARTQPRGGGWRASASTLVSRPSIATRAREASCCLFTEPSDCHLLIHTLSDVGSLASCSFTANLALLVLDCQMDSAEAGLSVALHDVGAEALATERGERAGQAADPLGVVGFVHVRE